MIYEPFSVVVVPFPFTDKTNSKKRPALVVSELPFQKETGHAALLMITSAQHSEWYGDWSIRDLKPSGLSVDSFVRQKIFTIDLRLIEKKIGALSAKDVASIKRTLRDCIAFK
ncbi:MAG: hypothetical protein A3I77_02135 [Gammaproteobacteria bacterium RIFCSPLOWO2_02_FULL_42_14]|nr:MAG: hypothetical protein A3B71_00835 [Gammaproteobacteria bacterium RIFCSPHIGHO2_02_FULL_42_43]OGT27665.1 MAG: hypothetical protein A2624_03390 [Gammaproteobacteria bacterium RIFCSPHIGHO2_01_FULL_42_8]OGT52153.1 MAG: hypothetical protein A3E54_06970 [Gammaproteobacteria bacterium RIFCSPHIGHO2_12_FULL_41_25]OGT62591.1 MAG: hypothetical protein A3I77_02135 [Gammaproteobacteria bacterium RIFCSPLOWO2_02_FULL_42_14]OGT86573.1 MAG: hypothetical protein A3G86_08655 [Gammaproteobacteria bacterium R